MKGVESSAIAKAKTTKFDTRRAFANDVCAMGESRLSYRNQKIDSTFADRNRQFNDLKG